MWHEYIMSDHCPEYEYLTIEEKLLVNIEMRKWFASVELQDLCVPMFIFREAERRIIEELNIDKNKLYFLQRLPIFLSGKTLPVTFEAAVTIIILVLLLIFFSKSFIVSCSLSKTLATDVYDIVGIDLDTKQIVYTELNNDKLSLYYLYKTKKPKKVTTNYDYGSSVVLTKEAIYFINKDSKLIHVKVNGSSVGKEKELSKDEAMLASEFEHKFLAIEFYKKYNYIFK